MSFSSQSASNWSDIRVTDIITFEDENSEIKGPFMPELESQFRPIYANFDGKLDFWGPDEITFNPK